jgi:hypothetical protein
MDSRISERQASFEVAQMDSGGVVSDGVWLQGRPLLGLMVPDMNAGGTVNVEVSIDGGTTWADLLTAQGTQAIAITAPAAAMFLSSEVLAPLAGYVGFYGEDIWDRVLVRLAATATQTADREFTWLMIA